MCQKRHYKHTCKSEGINIFSQKFGQIEFTIFVVKFLNLCVTHIWTRTVTDLPIVKGFMTNVMDFTLLFYCTVFNANDIFL